MGYNFPQVLDWACYVMYKRGILELIHFQPSKE